MLPLAAVTAKPAMHNESNAMSRHCSQQYKMATVLVLMNYLFPFWLVKSIVAVRAE